jgi:hypothetical protein
MLVALSEAFSGVSLCKLTAGEQMLNLTTGTHAGLNNSRRHPEFKATQPCIDESAKS